MKHIPENILNHGLGQNKASFYFPKPSTKSHLQKGSKDKMRGCIKGGEGCWDKWLRVRVSIEGPLGGRLVRVCLANGNDGQMGLPWGRRRTHGTICDALFIPIITAIANSTIENSNIEPSSLPLLSLLARHPIGLSPSAHPSPTYWGLALPQRPSFCQLPFLLFNTFSLFHFMTIFGEHCVCEIHW